MTVHHSFGSFHWHYDFAVGLLQLLNTQIVLVIHLNQGAPVTVVLQQWTEVLRLLASFHVQSQIHAAQVPI